MLSLNTLLLHVSDLVAGFQFDNLNILKVSNLVVGLALEKSIVFNIFKVLGLVASVAPLKPTVSTSSTFQILSLAWLLRNQKSHRPQRFIYCRRLFSWHTASSSSTCETSLVKTFPMVGTISSRTPHVPQAVSIGRKPFRNRSYSGVIKACCSGRVVVSILITY